MRSQQLRWRPDRAAFDAALAAPSPSFVVYFGPNEVIEAAPFQAALGELGGGATLGCTTGTSIVGLDMRDGEAFAVAAWLERGAVRAARADVSRDGSHAAGARLAAALAGPDLAGVLVLCDSLNVDGVALVDGLRANLPTGVVVAGGLASDGASFERTIVGVDGPPSSKVAGALGFYGPGVRMTKGCAHGWDVFGPPRRITSAAGLDLFELDDSPALDLYERYLGEDSAELPSSALRFPLLISNPEDPEDEFVRTVLGVDRDRRSMTFASPIPSGWNARLMRGAFDHLTEGAGAAAAEAAIGAAPDASGLALLVSCVGRRIVMGQDTPDEIEAVARALPPNFAQFGFYSHGEISTRARDARCGLHNQTMTIVAIQESV